MKRTHKLKNCGGFTLAETLMAVLILLLVSGIVARGIPVVSDVYEKTVLSANAQSLLSTTISALRDELGTAWDVQVDPTKKKVSYHSADTGNRSELMMDAAGTIKLTEYLSIDALKPKTVGGEESSDVTEGEGESSDVIERMLIPDATLTRDFIVTYGSVDYKDGIVVFTNLQVAPKKTGNVIASMDSLSIKVISPTPPSE